MTNIPEELLNHIAVGDAAQLLKLLPDECVDLTVTSPPYDNLRSYNGYVFDFEAIAAQLYRVTKTGGVVVWVVSDETYDGTESCTSFEQALYFRKKLGFNLHDTMIYEQAGTGAKGSNLAYWQSFEYMFVFSKGKIRTVNRIADVKNSVGGKVRGFAKKSAQFDTRVEREGIVNPEWSVRPNIWRYTPADNLKDRTNHPAVFPAKLAHDHILSWSNAGDVVLDPMCGSGTTCKEAKELGRNWIGFEISAEYAEDARTRVFNARTPLFVL